LQPWFSVESFFGGLKKERVFFQKLPDRGIREEESFEKSRLTTHPFLPDHFNSPQIFFHEAMCIFALAATFSLPMDQILPIPIHVPISALCEKFNPRNIRHMSAVKFFACLDLERKF
jgi:hypothetical protein